MKRLTKPTVAVLLMVLLTVAIVTSCSKQDAQTVAPTTETTAQVVEQPTEPIATTEPLYDPATHENGYCEGNCWEGICPYFTGYPEPPFTDNDVEMMAKTVWGEARGCTPEEQRLVVWTVLQRVDADGEFRNYTEIAAVITRPNWFIGYNENNPINADIYALCLAELTDWWHGAEPPTHEIYAPTAPYYFFDGDGSHNWFREVWK